jgi:hypothetical protein
LPLSPLLNSAAGLAGPFSILWRLVLVCLLCGNCSFACGYANRVFLIEAFSGAQEIHWRDIDRIYFGSYEIHVHYIALGTFYRLRLVTKQGTKLSLGERLHSADVLAGQIQGYTLPEMLRKALSEFESGVELDFGKIRISRKKGVRYERWFAWHEIRWEDLTLYGVSDSHVNLGGAKRIFQVNIAAEKIANIHVLEALLDRVRKGTLRVGA